MKQPSAAGEALPRELTDFLVELANAINKHAMYPDGHPVLLTVADALARSLGLIFRDRAAIAMGISPTQIIIAGLTTDTSQVLVRDLAARLHRRNIGAIKLYRGVEPSEIVDLLRVVARDSATSDDGAPMERRWPHIRLHPVSYSQLELVGDIAEAGKASSWATTLWLGLAVAALETEAETESGATPAALAQAIDARKGDDEYGQRIAGQLTDLLDACRARGGAEAMALESQISRLIGSMAPETLERLVSLEPNEAERKRFLLEMSQAMAVDAVLDLVQAAARATSRTISPALVQLLGKMANHAQEPASDVRVKAELAFRQQVRSLIEGWDEWEQKDPAPDDYQRTLTQLAAAGKGPLRGPSHNYECEPERTLQLSLEVGVGTDATREAAGRLLESGELRLLLDLLDRSPNYGLAAELRHQVITPESLGRALQKSSVDFTAIATMVRLVGAPALPMLLDQLEQAPDPETLQQYVAMLKGLGDGLGEAAVGRLAGAQWPAQRNLLTLLAALPGVPADFQPAEFTRNPDPTIRNISLRILLGGGSTRGRAICDALAGEDTATVRLGIAAAVEGCPPAAVPLLIRQIEQGDFEPGVKAAAIRAIAPVKLPLVVDFLVGLSTTRTLWLRRKRLAHRSPQVIAAVTGLGRHWAQHPRAREVLGMARAHAEAEFRAAATGSSS
ncbi:MAG: hypothetical protein ABI836_08325 [Gemmatimonadota bacterium]